MFIIKVSLYNFGSIYSSIKSIQYSLFPKSSFQKCIVFYLEIAQSNQEEESGPVFRLSEEERFPEDKPEEEVVHLTSKRRSGTNPITLTLTLIRVRSNLQTEPGLNPN